MSRRLHILGLSAITAITAVTMSAAMADEAPSQPVFDPASIDKSADACGDLFQYACGGWIASHPAPADQPSWGRFNLLALENRAKLRALLDVAAAHPEGDAQKVGDFYAACLDDAAIDAKGVAPLRPELDRIAALTDRKDLPGLLAHLQSAGLNVGFAFGSDTDRKDATKMIAEIDQAGLGLPDRDYYFKTDAKSVEQRDAYQAHVARMFVLAGATEAEAAVQAKAVMTVETALAKAAMTKVQRRDPTATYHVKPRAALASLAPGFDWKQYFTATEAPGFATLNVAVPAFVTAFGALFETAPLDEIKAYLTWHALHAAAAMLSKPFVDENFAFYGTVLSGAKEIQPRWRRCVIATDGGLGEALGKLYVAKNFGPEAKAGMKAMIADLRVAYAEELKTLPWMGEATKKKALEKLDAMADKIGYPDKWRDYSALVIKRDDALGNVMRADAFENRRDLNKIGKPVDRSEWDMTPPTVNAYYAPDHNDINFPAGILQPPFFSLTADDAANFGAIGAVIGHEITHGFDDEGRQYDKNGNLNDWWTKDDAKRFEERASCLAEEAGNFTAVDDVKQNGRLTLGENAADNGGVRIALRALENRLKVKPEGDVDGYTAKQRFFLAYAQNWCNVSTPELLRLRALNDPHPAAKFRVNGVIQNMPEFAEAFQCKTGAPMAPAKVCRVW